MEKITTTQGLVYIPITEMWLEYLKNREKLSDREREQFLKSVECMNSPFISLGEE